jgi:hypothetical protein
VSVTDTIPAVEPIIEPPVAPTRQGSRFGSYLGGAVLVVLGSLWALDLAGTIDVRLAIVLPSLLIVFGLALIIGATGGPHSGLVVAGLFLSIAVVIAAALPATFSGGVGERQFRITEQTALASSYEVGFGDLRLDLRDLDMVESAEVSLTAGAGQITVLLPPSVPVEIIASSGAGEVDLLGETADGLAVSRTYKSESYDTADIRLSMVIDVTAGAIEVTR